MLPLHKGFHELVARHRLAMDHPFDDPLLAEQREIRSMDWRAVGLRARASGLGASVRPIAPTDASTGGLPKRETDGA